MAFFDKYVITYSHSYIYITIPTTRVETTQLTAAAPLKNVVVNQDSVRKNVPAEKV